MRKNVFILVIFKLAAQSPHSNGQTIKILLFKQVYTKTL